MTLEHFISKMAVDSSIDIESEDCRCRIEIRVMHTGEYMAFVKPLNECISNNYADTGEELIKKIAKSFKKHNRDLLEADWDIYKTRVQLKAEIATLKARITELEENN